MKLRKINHLKIITICSLSAAVLCAGVFSYAWYINNRIVSTNGDVSVETSSNLQICDASKGMYATGLTMTRKASYNFVDLTSDGNTFYNPTSLGKDYSNPESFSSFTDVTHEREVTKGEYSFYIFLDLKIRSSVLCNVYLSADSYIEPKELSQMEDCEANPSNYSSDSESSNYYMTKFKRPSANGVFSQDGIAGAARVAFYSVENVPVVTSSNYQNYFIVSETNSNEYVSAKDTTYSWNTNYYRLVDDDYVMVPNVSSELTLNSYDCFYTDGNGLDHSAYITQNSTTKFNPDIAYFTKDLTLLNVWIPNPQYQLTKDTVNTFSLNGTIEDEYGYAGEQSGSDLTEMKYYSTDDYLNHNVSVGSNLAVNEEGNNRVYDSQPLLTFTETSKPQELVAKIWFEGTDRESYPYLDGGQVNYNLSFVGLTGKAKTNEITDSEKENLYFDYENRNISGLSTEGTYEYSTNGAQWETYTQDTTLGYGKVDNATYLYEVTSEVVNNYVTTASGSSALTSKTRKYSWTRDKKQMPLVNGTGHENQIMIRKKETETSLPSDPIWVTIGNKASMSVPEEEEIDI